MVIVERDLLAPPERVPTFDTVGWVLRIAAAAVFLAVGGALLAFVPGAKLLISSCRNGLAKVIQSDTGKEVASLPIGRGPDAFSRTLQIDRGSADGVGAGMIVVSGAGLVGRVREGGPHGAIVQTLADPQSRANVFLSGSGLQGTIIGGPTALQLQLEHRVGSVASKGEWAITSGVGGGYPRGLVVGDVVSVTHSDAATIDSAFVDWVNDPAALSLVIVVLDFSPS